MDVKLFKKVCEEEGLHHLATMCGLVEYGIKNPVFDGYYIQTAQLSCEFDDDGEPTDEPEINIFISSAFYPLCKGFNRHVNLKGHYCTEKNLRDHLKRVQEAYEQIKENIKTQTVLTVDQFTDMLHCCEVSCHIDHRKVMKKTKIDLGKPILDFLKGFEAK